MGLTLQEQEVVINFDRARDTMSIYTADPYLLERLKKLPAYRLIREHRHGGEVVAADFVADKKLLRLRDKLFKRELTEEQKAANARNLQKTREERG